MRAVLISTYELGRQPFGLASPAAWLRRAGVEVACFDLSRSLWDENAVRAADLIAFYVPMHTATRLAVEALPRVRELNSRAHISFYGLYAPVNEAYLRSLGVQTIIGGEFEEELTGLALRIKGAIEQADATGDEKREKGKGKRAKVDGEGPLFPFPFSLFQPTGASPLPRLHFVTPDRGGLPPLKEYAHVVMPGGVHRVAGYTEASRGCKHLCRHCPIVPVYNGAFRVVQPEVVLADVRQQVAAGAQHITLGDPDFFNGPAHAMRVVEDLHREFPQLTYDVTIKVEHLLKHADLLPRLHATGCLFVITAVESVDDAVLLRLDKGHTREDFRRVVELFRGHSMVLQPTFVPFTLWTTLGGYADLLHTLVELDLVENVAPIQLAIRLLIPAGSRLLELEEVRLGVLPFDPRALAYPWKNADSRVDALQREIESIVESDEKLKRPRARTFERIWEAVNSAFTAGASDSTRGDTSFERIGQMPPIPVLASRATIPYLNEPWYC